MKDMESGDETTVLVEAFPPEDGLSTYKDYE